MNAPFTLGTPGLPDDVFLCPHHGEARVIVPVPAPRGLPFIAVTVGTVPFRVYYRDGVVEQVHAMGGDDLVLPGLRAMDCRPDCLHGQAAIIAAHLLAGIRRGERASVWPAPDDEAPPAPGFWRWSLSSVAFAAFALVLMFVVILVALALRGDR